jgi:hypothetical protein
MLKFNGPKVRVRIRIRVEVSGKVNEYTAMLNPSKTNTNPNSSLSLEEMDLR